MFQEYEYIQKQLKQLSKQEDEVLRKICEACDRQHLTYERNGKLYLNRDLKQKYCALRDEELLPIQERYFALVKKNNDLVERMIEEGLVDVMYVQIVGMARPKINDKVKYCRLLLKLSNNPPIY